MTNTDEQTAIACRIEVIDSTGRPFSRHYEHGVEIHVQDDGRTIKIIARGEVRR